MGERDRRARWLVAMACLLLAGCGTSTVTQRPARARSKAPSQTAAQHCAMVAQLHPGVAFPGWHMGAVQFFSTATGVGVTAENFPCYLPIRGGFEVGTQRQPVRLAVTSDGGRSWQVTGPTLPLGSVRGGVVAEQLAATSPADVWALVGRGRLVATHDGGADWQVQRIPNPVVEVTAGAGFVWAVSCPHVVSRDSLFACRPQLWRTRSANDPWMRVALPRVTAQAPFFLQFAITANGSAIVNVLTAGRRGAGELLISDDAGLRWITRPDPSWDHNKCDRGAGATLTAAPTGTFWLLCIGNGAAGSSTKGLLRSTNTGETWTTVSAATSFTQHPQPGSIPLEEPSALAAGSHTRLWLSLTNDLAKSNDGGYHWTSVPGVNTGGSETVFDVLSASQAWLLADGAGLWRTTDGLHWGAVGPLNTG